MARRPCSRALVRATLARTGHRAQLGKKVRKKQDAAIGLGSAFAPRTRAGLLLRNAVFGLMGVPFVANLAMGRSLRDPIELPPSPTG